MTRPLSRLLAEVAGALDRRFGWHKLPLPLSIPVLIGLRERLREKNLHDTPASPRAGQTVPRDNRHLTARTADGSFNDLGRPEMGAAGMPFGRNVPLERARQEPEPGILSPSPRLVSRALLTRDEFKPATTLNVLAAAWLQFMIRDWFKHARGDVEKAWKLPLREDDPWHEDPMLIPRTPEIPGGSSPPAYENTETHWWDASQLYGSSDEQQRKVRAHEDGKLALAPDGSLPEALLAELAREPGWWVGLALVFTLFAREHNVICDRLKAEYPAWTDEQLFQRARLVNAALLAKIHTVEWTTAILGHPALRIAMRANWWGLAGERIHRLLGRVSKRSGIVSGIPGSPTDHFGVPYSITEEFVAVYRMHPLIPDHFTFRPITGDGPPLNRTLREMAGQHVQPILGRVPMVDLLYSFGTANPGAVTLRNYPRFLQEFERPDGKLMDLAATDIMRARELGVPRYNDFRELLGRPRVRSFEELTDDPAWAEEMRRVYEGDVDRVDLMIGLYAEPLPEGFGFSDTAFRIFVLMASRRLNSDRFFTADFTPNVYTRVGMQWIADNDMTTVLIRHYPDLLPALRGAKNAFAPWPRAGMSSSS